MALAKPVAIQVIQRFLPGDAYILMVSRLASHGHRRAPCNLIHRELYCSRGAVRVYRMGLLYTFVSVLHVSSPVHVTSIPPHRNVLRLRLQVPVMSSGSCLNLSLFVFPILIYWSLVYDEEY